MLTGRSAPSLTLGNVSVYGIPENNLIDGWKALDRRFNGFVESTGFGVFPEDGRVAGGLPDIQRTLNWVHLSARFPVRVHIQDPDPAVFRIGATAVTVVR